MSGKIKIGISQGDVNGISYEVIIKALMDNRIGEICTPVIFGSPKVAAYHKKALDIENFSPMGINSPDEAKGNRSYIINCIDDNIRVVTEPPPKLLKEFLIRWGKFSWFFHSCYSIRKFVRSIGKG